MKSKKVLIIAAAAVVLLAALTALLWNSVLDLLPIDQSRWKETEDGRVYLNSKGDPVTGWADIDGSRYYFDPETCTAVTGWAELDGSRYHMASNGAMSTGWLDMAEGRYYLGTTGVMHTGWTETDVGRCLLDENGILRTGWLEENGDRYYLGENGAMAVGWLDMADGRCYFNGDGTQVHGWLATAGGRFYLDENGHMVTGWETTPDGLFYLNDDGAMRTGWLDLDGSRYYLTQTGTAAIGWAEMEDGLRYFHEDGAMHTGWLELDGSRYYLKEDGTAARGKLVIDGETCFFTSAGVNFIMVNPWNPLPEGFEVELVQTTGGWVSPECKDALELMLSDCRADGYSPRIVSSYRSIADQTVNLQNMVNSYLEDGYAYASAYAAATQIVAVPGTSEHHLGLALDIVDSAYPKLNHEQANMPTQKWLMENCWRYGFIMRYPVGSTEITGIIYEPWHYRYVGLELAKEIHDLGDIPLEVYLDRLTNDGTTCGGKLVTE